MRYIEAKAGNATEFCRMCKNVLMHRNLHQALQCKKTIYQASFTANIFPLFNS